LRWKIEKLFDVFKNKLHQQKAWANGLTAARTQAHLTALTHNLLTLLLVALEQAGEKARGGILYVNLEPCSHQGRTGPCADAVIAAGVRRVVACMPDPNPLVAGKGFERLRNAGVSVASGILEDEAKVLNEAFAKYIRHREPLVTLKAAMTLDGKIGRDFLGFAESTTISGFSAVIFLAASLALTAASKMAVAP